MFKHRLSRQGFTLVELSIVLVVIGLLIGGVLIGQSLIGSARINAQIKQLQQLDIANQGFITKFRRVPGDTDKDGWLEDYYYPHTNNVPCRALAYGGECGAFFGELSTMGGMKGSFSSFDHSSQPNLFGPGKYGPYADIGKGGIYAAQAANKSIWWIIGAARSRVGQPSGSQINAFTPEQALAVDNKIDDGLGRSGDIAVISTTCYFGAGWQPTMYASSPYGDPLVPDPSAYAIRFEHQHGECCVIAATGAYKPSVTTPTCALQFKSKTYR